MATDPGRDLFPVRESDDIDLLKLNQADLERSFRSEKRTILQLGRDELEDKYLRLQDEHLLIKKHARKQEDKIKKLATKLTRLVNDKKRLQQDGGSGASKRDVEMEEMIQDLQDKVRELEKQNCQLREKLLVVKQQALVRAKRPGPYSHVSSKVDSGRPRTATPLRIRSPATRLSYFSTPSRISPSALPQYAWGLVEEARNEIKNMEDIVNSHRAQVDVYEQEIEILKEQLRLKEFEYNEELLALNAQLTQGQKKHVQENMDLIQLHREVKLKSNKMATLQAQFNSLEEKTRSLKMSNDLLLKETDELNKLLREQQTSNMKLQEELREASSMQKTIVQLQKQINDLTGENEILKESNEKLINSAVDEERYKQYQSRESTLKMQIAKLEASFKSDIDEKESLKSQLAESKEKNNLLESRYKELEENYRQTKERLLELESKMKIFEDIGPNASYLEEALVLAQKKMSGEDIRDKSEQHDDKNLKLQLYQSQVEHAETIAELEKTRNMLLVQYKLNKDYEAEVEVINKKSVQIEKEYKAKLEEYTHLLDLRASRINKLERQLNDIVYGTKQYNLRNSVNGNDVEAENIVELERGQNLFEIHVNEVTFTQDGLKAMNSNNPSTFVTWAFYEFELQTTPVLKGSRPKFNCTSQYTITVDDFFLHYLQWGTTKFELHQAFGMEHKTIAAGHVGFKDIFDNPHNRFHGTLKLTDIKDGETGTLLATLDYWLRFHLFIEQTITSYKERCKGLGYLLNNQNLIKTALRTLDSGKGGEIERPANELHIKIFCCNGLKGKKEDIQPSPYCVYKFYNLPDQDTAIIPFSNNPEFHDHKSFPLKMSNELDLYLKTQTLQIYAFDDSDPEPSSYLGKALIPLISLANGRTIQGTFELLSADGEKNGTIDISMYWHSAYTLPPEKKEIIQTKELTKHGDGSPKNSKSSTNSDNLPATPSHNPPRTSTPSNSVSSAKEDSGKEWSLSPDITPVASRPEVMPRKSLLSQASYDSPKKTVRDITNNRDKQAEIKLLEEIKDSPKSGKCKQVSFEAPPKIYCNESDETDSEDVVVSRLVHQSSDVKKKADDFVVIIVSHLQLYEGSPVLDDPNVKMLFVEYKFLDYPPEELETPFALPKPFPPQCATYNFKKVFYLDTREHLDKRKKLQKMLRSRNEEDCRIAFTVVSEPAEDCQDMDCEDIGYGFINLKELLHGGKDFIDRDIKICDASDKTTVIGKLTVTIEAVSLLKAVQTEI